MNNHYVICSCNSVDHTVRFVDDGEDLWVEVQLNSTKNFVQRIVAATKYIFGYKSLYGHWDCTLLNAKEAKKLYHFLKRYSKC